MNPIPTLSIIALMTLASNAPASAQAFEGRYANRADTHFLTIKKLTPSTYKVSLGIAMPGRCSGDVTATATLSGQTLQTIRGFTADPPYRGEKAETCRLTLTRTPKGFSVKEQSCFNLHGASCEYTSDYAKR